jgi:hypothetical protein
MARKRVCITLELDTDQPIATLRRADWWTRLVGSYCEVVQADANMIRPAKPTSMLPRRRPR